jgi:hypothetical protein
VGQGVLGLVPRYLDTGRVRRSPGGTWAGENSCWASAQDCRDPAGSLGQPATPACWATISRHPQPCPGHSPDRQWVEGDRNLAWSGSRRTRGLGSRCPWQEQDAHYPWRSQRLREQGEARVFQGGRRRRRRGGARAITFVSVSQQGPLGEWTCPWAALKGLCWTATRGHWVGLSQAAPPARPHPGAQSLKEEPVTPERASLALSLGRSPLWHLLKVQRVLGSLLPPGFHLTLPTPRNKASDTGLCPEDPVLPLPGLSFPS